MKLYSWNINGLRAVIKKGALQKFLDEHKPDVLCLQEIKCKPEQIEQDFPGYKIFYNSAERPGYSGTAILFSEEYFRFAHPKMYIPDACQRMTFLVSKSSSENSIAVSSNVQRMTFLANEPSEENNIAVHEGRVQVADCENFYLVNVYVPNSKRDLSRLKLRETEWDPELLNFLKELEKEKPVVICGDFNAAHTEIDLARPKTNHHNAGFTDEERKGVTNLLAAGFVDTFRVLHPDEQRYTWWSHMGHARENNVGWRIDYFFISKSLKKNLKTAEIYENVTGSDHCPVSIELEF